MEHKIEGEDVYGDPWYVAKPPPGDIANGACARLSVVDRGEMAVSMLGERSASQLGAFLLSAAGVKFVEAARAAIDAIDAHDHKRMTVARDALAAELAKLDALTGDK